MGRKSNKKKKVRKLVEEKQSEEKGKLIRKKSKKQLKKEAQKEIEKVKIKPNKKRKGKKQPKKAAKPEKVSRKGVIKKKLIAHKRKIMGGALTVIMILILVSVGYLLFERAFRAAPIAKFLPADRTVSLLEVNTNIEYDQYYKSVDLLAGHAEYSKDAFTQQIEEKFLVSFDADILPWLGRQIGVAYMQPKEGSDRLQTAYFAETLNQAETKKLLTKEGDIYKTEKGLFAAFIDDYIFVSFDEATITQLQEDEDTNKLYSSAKYRRIDNNLPISRAAYLYIDFEKVSDSFFNNFEILSEKGLSMEVIGPFIKLFEAEGFALIAMDDNFVLESFLSIDSQKVTGSKYINFKEKYRANLSKYLSADTLAYWGGKNLEYQMKRMLELMSGGDKGAVLILDSVAESYIEKYFGPETSLKDDVLSLLKNEYLLAIEQINGNYIYKLVTELDNQQTDALKIQELANKFTQMGGFFEPKVVEHVLPDGTVSKEIVALPEEIKKSESEYNGVTIYKLKMGEQEWGVYYALLGDIAVVANHIDGVKSAIDLGKNPTGSLKNSEVYVYNIAPVLRSSDQVTYFKFEDVLPLLIKDENKIPSFMKIIYSLSSGKNYFNDGVKTTNYLHIK